jgi:hypothetical protein
MTQPTVADPLAQLGPAIRQALDSWRAALDDARRRIEADTRLTPGGKGEAHADALNALRPQWAAHADALDAQIGAVVTSTRNAALDMLPDPAPGAEGILDRTARWGRWSRFLESRPNLRPQEIIDGASDPEDLFMLADELPMWLTTAGLDAEITSLVPVLIARRLAQVTGPQAEAAWHAADLAEITAARLMPMLELLRAEVGEPRGRDAVFASASGEIAAAQTRATLGWPR